MTGPRCPCRPALQYARLVTAIVVTSVLAASFAGIASAASSAASAQTVLMLRPHCEKSVQEECHGFAVEDPVTLRTQALHEGDTLDVDIVLENPNGYVIDAVRAWLSYDPQILEGLTVELGKTLPLPVPGEANFAESKGTVQIGEAAVRGKEPKSTLIVIARVQWKVKHIPDGGKSPISFYDLIPATNGHTVVVRDVQGQKQNILPDRLGSLLVLIQKSTSTPTPSSASSFAPPISSSSSLSSSFFSSAPHSSESAVGSASPAPRSPEGVVGSSSSAERTAFVLLQVQNLRIGTDGTAIFVAWDPLPSAELQGYNVYYGAETGRYIQRKSIAAQTTSLALRALPPGTTYYAAVRAVNTANEESAFSQEVAVKVGDPRSSTAPLAIGDTDRGPNGRNPLAQGKSVTTQVPGEAGMPSLLTIFLILSAIIGTAIAFRRQCAASSHEA